MAFGLLGLFLDTVFLLERNSILHLHLIKEHEDQVWIVSSGLALAGIVLGLVLLKYFPQGIFIKIGTILSTASLLFSTLGL